MSSPMSLDAQSAQPPARTLTLHQIAEEMGLQSRLEDAAANLNNQPFFQHFSTNEDVFAYTQEAQGWSIVPEALRTDPDIATLDQIPFEMWKVMDATSKKWSAAELGKMVLAWNMMSVGWDCLEQAKTALEGVEGVSFCDLYNAVGRHHRSQTATEPPESVPEEWENPVYESPTTPLRGIFSEHMGGEAGSPPGSPSTTIAPASERSVPDGQSTPRAHLAGEDPYKRITIKLWSKPTFRWEERREVQGRSLMQFWLRQQNYWENQIPYGGVERIYGGYSVDGEVYLALASHDDHQWSWDCGEMWIGGYVDPDEIREWRQKNGWA